MDLEDLLRRPDIWAEFPPDLEDRISAELLPNLSGGR
jgi:hypothetical protein